MASEERLTDDDVDGDDVDFVSSQRQVSYAGNTRWQYAWLHAASACTMGLG